MAEVAIGRVCPRDGHTLLTYAGKKSDPGLSAYCFVCTATFTTANPQYIAPEGMVPTPIIGASQTAPNAEIAPDTGESVNPDGDGDADDAGANG